MTAKKYRWVCTTCGSSDVNCSGTLRFSYTKQDWIFDGVPMDDDYCEECEDEAKLAQIYDGDPNPYKAQA